MLKNVLKDRYILIYLLAIDFLFIYINYYKSHIKIFQSKEEINELTSQRDITEYRKEIKAFVAEAY